MKWISWLVIGTALFCSAARAEFFDEVFISGQSFITTVAFSPDGKIYFIEKDTGLIKVILGRNLVRPEPFFQFQVNNLGERGGLGLTFHPQYPDSPYVYCYVTIPQPVLANVVVRLVDSDGFGVNPDTILQAPITSGMSNHNGGNLRFGPDGKLYVTIGENAQETWAQDTCRVQGKILRLNYDGTIPDDNPIGCAPIYAYGLRNSYDFCFHPQTGALYAGENGPDANDEVNLILPGRNYGWPLAQCSSSDPDFENALWCWTPSIAPTGIVVAWDCAIPEFDGKLLMTDWLTGTLHVLTLSQNGQAISSDERVFSEGSGLIDVEQGLDGFIYLTTSAGSIIRLRPRTNAPSPFPLRAPSPGQKVVSRTTRFAWAPSSDAEGAVSYQLQVAGDAAFEWPFLLRNTSGTADSLLTDSLYALGRSVYWRVLAIDGDNQVTYGGSPMAERRHLRVLLPGDANANGERNGADIVFLISYLKGIGAPPSPFTAGDANGDCMISIADVVYLLDYFKGGALPIRGECPPEGDPVGR